MDLKFLKEELEIDQHRVVTLIGAGGKTSTMYWLAREMTATGKKVLVTTTTKIYQSIYDQERFVQADTLEEWLEQVGSQIRTGDFLVAGSGVREGKVLGVNPVWVDELARRGIFDLIIVEGDGAARKPLKAPATFEPVVPASTTLLLVVMGLRVLGKPLSGDIVHRLERFKALTGRQEGVAIRVEDYFQVFVHPEGYNLPGLMQKYKVVPLVNQVDTLKQENKALRLAGLFQKIGISLILLTSHRYENIIRRVIR